MLLGSSCIYPRLAPQPIPEAALLTVGALVERLKAALSTLAPKLHELREMDEWKRFANAGRLMSIGWIRPATRWLRSFAPARSWLRHW